MSDKETRHACCASISKRTCNVILFQSCPVGSLVSHQAIEIPQAWETVVQWAKSQEQTTVPPNWMEAAKVQSASHVTQKLNDKRVGCVGLPCKCAASAAQATKCNPSTAFELRTAKQLKINRSRRRQSVHASQLAFLGLFGGVRRFHRYTFQVARQ